MNFELRYPFNNLQTFDSNSDHAVSNEDIALEGMCIIVHSEIGIPSSAHQRLNICTNLAPSTRRVTDSIPTSERTATTTLSETTDTATTVDNGQGSLTSKRTSHCLLV